MSYKEYKHARDLIAGAVSGVRISGTKYALASVIEINDKPTVTLSPSQYPHSRAKWRSAIGSEMKNTVGNENNIGAGMYGQIY